jgi:uncharacterized protein DUF6496
MPDKSTLKRVKQDRKRGDSASTQAGEFVRQEMDHIRAGKHGAKNAKQAIAIGLSEARRAGIDVKRKGQSAAKPTRKKSSGRKASATRRTGTATKARRTTGETRARRSKAALKVLKREPRRAASHLALSRHAHAASRKRTAADRSRAAKKGARTRAANR